jgi:hypothetical protein
MNWKTFGDYMEFPDPMDMECYISRNKVTHQTPQTSIRRHAGDEYFLPEPYCKSGGGKLDYLLWTQEGSHAGLHTILSSTVLINLITGDIWDNGIS